MRRSWLNFDGLSAFVPVSGLADDLPVLDYGYITQ
jgi:hypothetical protein